MPLHLQVFILTKENGSNTINFFIKKLFMPMKKTIKQKTEMSLNHYSTTKSMPGVRFNYQSINSNNLSKYEKHFV